MKRILIIVIIGVVASALGFSTRTLGQTQDKGSKKGESANKASAGSKAEAEVIQAINERRAALLRGDADAYARQTADDYLMIGADGRVRNKAEVVAAIKSSEGKWLSIDHSELRVRIYGNTAVVTYISTGKYTQRGQEVSSQTGFTQVLVKQQGQWRFVSMHQSSVAPTKTP